MKPFLKMKHPIRGLLIALTLLTMGVALPAYQALADKGDLKTVGTKKAGSRLVSLTMGKGELVDVTGDIADVLVADPSVADVVAIQSNKLYIVGSKLGDTNLVVLDANGNELQKFDIHVRIDEVALQSYLKTNFPDENIIVKSLNMRVMLSGDVSTPDVAQRVTKIVAAYMSQIMQKEGEADGLIVNLLHVSGEQQVMLKVRVLEANKTLLKELGIETNLTTNNSTTLAGDHSSYGTLGSTARTGLTADPFGIGTFLFNDAGIGPGSILINALQKDNLVRTLAEPNLTAISGQEAGFLAGGEFPVPSGRDTFGNITVQFRAFGVSLNFKPIVLSENRISLQLKTEVSSLSRENGVTLSGLTVPGLNIRRASTTVELPSGGGMMIGGLLESQTVKGMAGLPGIMDTPVLGDLIKSRSFNRQESELVVLVTAYLVKPYGDKRAEIPAKSILPPMTPGQNMNLNPAMNDMPAINPAAGSKLPPVQQSYRSDVDNSGNEPMDTNEPLRHAFADNIRRIYGRKAPDDLNEPGRYGYITE